VPEAPQTSRLWLRAPVVVEHDEVGGPAVGISVHQQWRVCRHLHNLGIALQPRHEPRLRDRALQGDCLCNIVIVCSLPASYQHLRIEGFHLPRAAPASAVAPSSASRESRAMSAASKLQHQSDVRCVRLSTRVLLHENDSTWRHCHRLRPECRPCHMHTLQRKKAGIHAAVACSDQSQIWAAADVLMCLLLLTMRLPRPPPDVTAYSEANTCASLPGRSSSNAVRRPNRVAGSAQPQHTADVMSPTAAR